MQWFKFYPKDFLDDEDVKAMDYEALGLYITMLCHCWTNDSMPSDIKKMCRIFNVSAHRFKKLWPQLSGKFFEKDMRFFNARILSEKSYLEKDFKEKSDIGRDNANKRWHPHDKPNADGITSAMQEPEPDIEVDIDIKPIVNSKKQPEKKPSVNNRPLKTNNPKLAHDVGNILKPYKELLSSQSSVDTPKAKRLVKTLTSHRELNLSYEKVLGLIIQAREAEDISNRMGYCIKILTDPKYAVGDGYLDEAKRIIRKWTAEATSDKVKDLIPDMEAE